MNRFEVKEPILNSPFEEPKEHWWIEEGKEPERRAGRRKPIYHYRPPTKETDAPGDESSGTAIELLLVSRVRERVRAWREQGWPGVTRTTDEVLRYWRRDGRKQRLFFAQLEAVETIVFLTEARADFRQGLDIPWDHPSAEQQAAGVKAFRRYACKMATGSGKTTVMGMLAAWSILNKVADRSDPRFSDAVFVVCPNVTIRNRLRELDPRLGEASLYRTRDLAPSRLAESLAQGRVLVTNWHAFEPQSVQVAGVSARVNKAGKPVRVVETLTIGAKTTSARGSRYITPDELRQQIAAGLVNVLDEVKDKQGHVLKVKIESWKQVESDAAVVARLLNRDLGGKQNLLVFNDEAHHAYRIPQRPPDADAELDDEEEEPDEELDREATVWIEGLDRIHKLRGVNLCVDLSATPYYLSNTGPNANRPFPWVVSDFGLTDAIESGLVKIPQLAVRDPSGAAIPGYFNIWRWVLSNLTTSERGGSRASAKPEAVLKWAHSPIAMLAAQWEQIRADWLRDRPQDPRPPVFIVVCKNTKIAKVVHEWLGDDKAPPGIPPARIAGFRNTESVTYTIRVDSKVVTETDTGEAKSDESAWMRHTLDTVGRTSWPKDSQGRELYPDGFEELAKKLERPLHAPGRDVRCIVSVGMLTEGWDCNTVTHVIGLRPFMSQLLCEQVVGRALRRSSYDVQADGRLPEEVAKVLGVPFQIVPFKESEGGTAPPPEKRFHVMAVAEKARFEIRFPRVEGYQQAVRIRLAIDWDGVPTLTLDPTHIAPEIEMKAGIRNNAGRTSLTGPGRIESVTLSPYRAQLREQEVAFQIARDLTRDYASRESCTVPVHVLFPQVLGIVRRYVAEKVRPVRPAETIDVALAPYYGWVIEKLLEAMRPDESQGEAPEIPRYEAHRGPGSTSEVDFWTSREPVEVVRSHLNYVVPDTKKWEQSAAYVLDKHPLVEAFVKNAGLGFTIPYFHNGEMHDYEPDFIARLKCDPIIHLIVETKGFDPRKQEKRAAAERWVRAVNADGSHGRWAYAMVGAVAEIDGVIKQAVAPASKARTEAKS